MHEILKDFIAESKKLIPPMYHRNVDQIIDQVYKHGKMDGALEEMDKFLKKHEVRSNTNGCL